MKYISKTVLLLTFLFSSSLLAIEEQYYDQILLIINAFKSQNKTDISRVISYPLRRTVPIPHIKNSSELINRFDEVFDENLIDFIANSDLEKDWSSVGWRGIMLSNGTVWLDSLGKIHAINYETSQQKALIHSIIEQQKLKLHDSINVYHKPILEWKTAKFHIRIDDLGDYNYRYASWSIDRNTSDTPDLVLFNGERTSDGSGGNHYYEFTNSKYIYRCYVTLIGHSDSAPGTLEVFRNKQLLLSDDVLEVLTNQVN